MGSKSNSPRRWQGALDGLVRKGMGLDLCPSYRWAILSVLQAARLEVWLFVGLLA